MNVHETKIHGKCPINGSWDYYDVTVFTKEFLACEELEELCDFVRGKTLEQERIAEQLHSTIAVKHKLIVEGMHGQNSVLTVQLGDCDD